MRRTFLGSFAVSFFLLTAAVVGASLTKLKPHSDNAGGFTGHTTDAFCAGCHSGTAVTGSFTDSAGNALTSVQLYPGETGTFAIKAAVASTYTNPSTPYGMGADIAVTDTTKASLNESEAGLVKSGAELQHTNTAPGSALKAVPSGGSNSYQFYYTLGNVAVGTTQGINGITCVDQPPGAGCAKPTSVTVTSRRPADPTSLTPGSSSSSSVVLNWLSNGPLNRVIVKTSGFASSPTDTTGTIWDFSGATGTVSGLSPTTTYFFRLWGHSSYSAIDTYSTNSVTTTAATTTAPLLAPTGLTVTNITARAADLTWQGTSLEFRAIYKQDSLPTSPTDGTLIYEGPNLFASPTLLAPSTRYFFAVYGKAQGSAQYSSTAVSTSIITAQTALVASNGGAFGGTWDVRTSPTRDGKFIYGTDTGDLNLFDGNSTQTIQPKGALTGNPNTVVTLGTGSSAGQLIGAWRRGTDDAYIAVIGSSPHLINATNPINPGTAMNLEVLTIDSGYAFAVFRAPTPTSEVRNAFVVDPTTGNATNITGNTTAYGVIHMSSSGNKAAFAFDDGTGALSIKLKYYNGTSVTTIDSGINGDPSVAQGRIVYSKFTGPGLSEIFLYDTNNPSPSPVQLTNNAAFVNDHPLTDGRHVAWIRSNANLTDPEIVINGVQVSDNNYTALTNNFPFNLDRGQLLWRDTSGTLHHLTSVSNDVVDPSISATRSVPWLADGYVVFFDFDLGSGANEIYRFTGRAPNDALQPNAPITLSATPGANSVTLQWDSILAATSYNVYYANSPGVTKTNYSSLPGGTRITGVTSSTFTVNSLASNAAYDFVVTAVDGSGEGPESRQASTVLINNPTWVPAALTGTPMASVAADRSISNLAYAAGGNNTYVSADNGTTWNPVADIAGQDVRALAADGNRVFATTYGGLIYRSLNAGGVWTSVASGTSGQFQQAIAIDPSIPNTIMAGDFRLSSFTGSGNDSDVIRSDDGGATWFHTPQNNSLVAYALAFDPSHSSTVFLGGNGTPNVARSLAGGAGWNDVTPGFGYVYAVAVDPKNSQVVYVGFIQSFGGNDNRGVWKSVNGGTTWTQLLPMKGLAVHAIVVDPADSNFVYAGTESGFYYSVNGGANWTLSNSGLGNVNAQFINALAMTGYHRLLAATFDGVYVLSIGNSPVPTVTSINPTAGNIAGGTSVTITGSNFSPAATVKFDQSDATNVVVLNSTTITANTPAHAAGAVNVTVRNPDGQAGVLLSGFTYDNNLSTPTDVSALAFTPTDVSVNWTPVGGATGYHVYRRSAATGGGFSFVGMTGAPPFTDSTATANNSYLYSVRAVNATTASGDSPADLATTVMYTDDPLTVGVAIKAVHVAQIRTAINALRALALLPPATFTGSAAAGTPVTAQQVNEMRAALDAGRTAIGYTNQPYVDPVLTPGTLIKTTHFQQLRNRMK